MTTVRRRSVQRRLAGLSSVTSLAISAPLALATTYVAVLTVAGIRPARRPAASPGGPPTRFAVMIPAHNEAGGIAATLASLADLDYPADSYAVHVVADNCTDATAQVVRSHRVRAHERVAPDHPGKGPALNWLRDLLLADGVEFDAAVIVDADTSVDAQFLSVADAHLRAGAEVLQGYYSVREPESSQAATFRYAALACRHYLRPLGRTRIGGSCGLYGNGMIFSRTTITTHDFSGHLVEDAEMQNELLLEGTKVAFASDAVLHAEMPSGLDAARAQNARWERGRLDLARRYVPPLARRAVTGPDRLAAADAVLDHITPPFSMLAGAHLAAASAAALARALGARAGRSLLIAHVAGLAVLATHVVVGLRAVRAPARAYRGLLSAPRQIVWKIGLWLAVATGRERASWTRTRRNVEVS